MSRQVEGVPISGFVEPEFEAIRVAFERNFNEFGDQGAAIALYVDGKIRVDLWGGVAEVATGRLWEEDTLALVYSATKGATAIVCHQLAERGELDLDSRVVDVWPEFGAGGKDNVTVRMLLSHQTGLPALDEPLTREQLLASRPVAEVLARQTPIWEPGTAHGYHALTYGWLLAEVVLRVTGRTVGQLFAQHVAGPLGIDFYIGLPESEFQRVAPLIPMVPPPADFLDQIADPDLKAFILDRITAMMDPNSLMSRTLSSNGSLPTPDATAWNSPDIYAAEIPAANGITNARSLAHMYAACLGEVDGVRLLSEETVQAAVAEQSSGTDQVVGIESRFGTGFMLDSPMSPWIGPASFGHTGAGGSFGFADRAAGMAFAYTCNQLGGGPTGDPRTMGLLSALRESLGV